MGNTRVTVDLEPKLYQGITELSKKKQVSRAHIFRTGLKLLLLLDKNPDYLKNIKDLLY